MANTPVLSLVTVAMLVDLPVESTAWIRIGTPVVLVGHGCWKWRYSIHPVMLSSETAGVPGCAADWSVTAPEISMPDPTVFAEAWTVTLLSPLPNAYVPPLGTSVAISVPYAIAVGV